METLKNEAGNLLLEYNVAIESKAFLDGDFVIEGIAINETTTSNGHVFLGEELEKSAKSLVGVPLLKDHNNSVDSIVGRVKTANFNQDIKAVPFSAKVYDKAMQEKIKAGLINSVSVGAHVDPKDITEDEDGNIVPHNITFKELSLVAIPADSGATFSVALNNAYSLIKNENLDNTERGLKTMTEEEQKPQEEPVVEPVEEPTEEPVEPVEEAKEEVAEADTTLLDKIAELEAKIAKMEVKEEEVEEEEDEDDEEPVEEKADLSIKQTGTAFSYERKSYVYN